MKRYAARFVTPIGNFLIEDVFAEDPTQAIEVAYQLIQGVIENADIEINFIEDEKQ